MPQTISPPTHPIGHWLRALCMAACLLAPSARAQTSQDTPPVPATQAFELVVLTESAPMAAWLSQHLDLQRYRHLSDLDDAEMARLLRDADVQARDLMATQGFFNPSLDWLLTATPGRAHFRQVQLTVLSGPQARIGQVDIRWQGDIDKRPEAEAQRRDVLQKWALPPGEAFTQEEWTNAKTGALRQLLAERYPEGRIAHSQALVDPETNLVQLQITLDSGPAIQLGPLVITGAERYGSEQVERLARLRPGSIYRQSDLLEAQQRLVLSGFYDSVFVSLDPDSQDTARPVKIELKEALRQKWVLGLGVRSESGLRLTVEHTQHKLPGLEWRAVSKLALDRQLQRVGVDLLAPPDPSLWRWNLSLQHENEILTSYTVSSQRLRAGRIQLSERIDRAYYAQYDGANTSADLAGQRESVSLNYAWTWRRFDSLPFPSQGTGWGLELGYGVTLGTPREPFGRWLARGMWLLPLGSQSGRLALRAETGSVVSKNATALPTTQLFIAGGDNSVRGYAPGSLGITQANGSIRPGQYLSVGSLEWQRPIRWNQQRTDWESAVFVDAGAVADQPSQLHAQLGYGVGARWRSPVGPLRIDLAYGQATQQWRLHLSVGFTF
ncbi:autotransporter assembly complex family protein [Limnohabitans sp. DM1]|uniref:autotransporter assembly complex protein TamA n=1 Tax=Limnohabitans sp. DM1 TaxID=1597955 RepID=UPI000AECE77C|nr:BamA/TamA family outer membrane protein [Limnohabitans sp. DM1]